MPNFRQRREAAARRPNEKRDARSAFQDAIHAFESLSSTGSDKDANSSDTPGTAKPVYRVSELSDVEASEEEDLSEEFYEVERIVGHENTEKGLFYLVRWKGFGKADDTWEPAENLSHATNAISDYVLSRKIVLKSALHLTQPWLYERDSDESDADKKHEQRIEQRKLIVQERERIDEEDKRRKKQKEKSFERCSSMTPGNKRKWQAESSYPDDSESSKADEHYEVLYGAIPVELSKESDNVFVGYDAVVPGGERSTANERNVDDQQQIFAVGKTNDGRIKVLVGTDEARRLVSLSG
ncbi:unnamed protein product [Angiostrongylus costaricensis]|uniref:Chromo domain-containing protein n=1 Tax=Angiostrongylus costaricensis TaxID=334426 RepID=A0A0R3PHJ6_ANGCS|nr:unnamed protein product [Angiostrongylus costaricensis]